MLEHNRNKMKQLIESKNHHKDDARHGKVKRKIGEVHQQFDSKKHGSPMNKIK